MAKSPFTPSDPDPEQLLWIVFYGLGAAVALSVGVWSWFQIRAWYWDDDDPAGDAGAFLSSLRESTREGDVSDEEFRSIQSRVMSRLEDDTTSRVSAQTEITDEVASAASEDVSVDSTPDPHPNTEDVRSTPRQDTT